MTGRTFAEHLDAVRARLFVGRHAELARLQALLDPGCPRRVALLWGPGGVGKTELLNELRRRVIASGEPVGWVDAGQVRPAETALTAAVDAALAAGSGPAPRLLVVDRFEVLGPLETWFRDGLLPSLSDETRLVLSGRNAPDPAWYGAGWQGLVEAMELGNLDEAAAVEYLRRRSVPSPRQADVLQVTRGYSLALALFADVVLRDPERVPTLVRQPDVVQTLLDCLLRDVPDDLHRQALWSAALVWHLNEEILRDMLDVANGTPLFDWLRGLSFMRAQEAGLVPHDLVRELLEADIKWRFPQLHASLLQRALSHYQADLQAHPSRRPTTLLAVGFLQRETMPFIRFSAEGLHVSTLREGDWPSLDAVVERWEGPQARELLHYWVERGGELALVRDDSGVVQGLALYLWLDRIRPDDAAADPGVAGLYRHLAARSALSGAVYMRFGMDRDVYQQPAPYTIVISAYALERFVFSNAARVAFSAWRDAEVGMQGLTPGMLAPVPVAGFDLGGHTYTVIGTTNGGQAVLDWFIDHAFGPFAEPEDDHAPDGLERSVFDAAVRQALRDFHRPERLGENPLMRSRLLPAGAGGADPLERIEELRQVLRDGCATLRESDHTDIGYVVLDRTFLQTRAKHLGVSIELKMPYSTYRRHMGRALERLTDWLWLRETSAAGASNANAGRASRKP